MYIILPMSTCVSLEKRDRFIGLLSNIAETTLDNEPRVQSYAWFRHAGDNDVVPKSFVRGFEVYEDLPASTEVHRSSDQYKAMRQVVQSEGLFERPSDLRYLRPVADESVSTVSGNQLLFQTSRGGHPEQSQYLIVDEIKPKDGQKSEVLAALAKMKKLLQSVDAVKLVVTLEYLPEYEDDAVASLVLYDSEQAYQATKSGSELMQNIFKTTDQLSESSRRTSWVTARVGFIGR